MAKGMTLILDTMIRPEKRELYAKGIVILNKYLKAASAARNVVDWDGMMEELRSLRNDRASGEVSVAQTSSDMYSTKYLGPVLIFTAGIFARDIIQLIFPCQNKVEHAEYSNLLEEA